MAIRQGFEPAGLPLREISLFLKDATKGGSVFTEALCKCAFRPPNGQKGAGHRVTIQRRPVAHGRNGPCQRMAQTAMQHPKSREPLEKLRVRNTLPRLPAQDPVL